MKKPEIFGVKHARKLIDHTAEAQNNFCLTKSVINLNVNSLGVPHKNARVYLNTFLDHWENNGTKGHFKDIEMPNGTIFPGYAFAYNAFREPAKILLGAKTSDETAVFNGQSVAYNILFRWLVESQRQNTNRNIILYERSAFPADANIISNLTRVINLNSTAIAEDFKLVEIPEDADGIIDEDELINLINHHNIKLAVIALGDGGVSWKTGQLLDLKRIGDLSKGIGAKLLVNLAHAVGTVPLELHEWNVSAAVGCLYKNMGAGAGGPSLVFIHENEWGNLDTFGLYGWFNSNNPIDSLQGEPLQIKRNSQIIEASNPCVASLLPAYATLEEYLKYPREVIHDKSMNLVNYFDALMHQIQENFGDPLRVVTPAHQRGSEIIFCAKDPLVTPRLYKYLTRNNILVDMRDDKVIRVGMFALTTSFEDVCKLFKKIWDFVETKK